MENKNSIGEKKIYSEKVVEGHLVEMCAVNNGMCIKLLCNHIIGLPDRLCLLPHGKIFFVELKTTGRKPRKIQQIMHDRLRSLGFKVFVADTIEKVDSILYEMLLCY